MGTFINGSKFSSSMNTHRLEIITIFSNKKQNILIKSFIFLLN